jgi:hypothetical protein
VASGDWATAGTWDGGVPGNGDTAVIANGHSVRFDADESGFANGLALITVNAGGIFHVKASAVTYLKMNGNVDVNGAFYIGERATVSDFTATESRSNVYQVARSLKTYSVEETLGNGYLAAYNEVMGAAIDAENARLRGLDENEMMADEVIAFIETTRTSITLDDYLDYVDDNPGSFYHDVANNLLYIHCSDSSNPSTKTITAIEPINRPAAGTENRCTIMFNPTGQFTNTGGGTPIIEPCGWHPDNVHTVLSADAASGQNQIVLGRGMDIQQGDTIAIGKKDIYATTPDANKGIYTVSNYNSETKTVTLSANLLASRFAGDEVTVWSRTIKIARSSGTTALISFNINNLQAIGVYFANTTISTSSGNSTGWKMSYCTSIGTAMLYYCFDSSLRFCAFGGGTTNVPVQNSVNVDVDDCVIISAHDAVKSCSNIRVNRIKMQNVSTTFVYYGTITFMNSVFKSMHAIAGEGGKFINCEFYTEESDDLTIDQKFDCIDCIFKSNTSGYFLNASPTLHNCLFQGETEITKYTGSFKAPHQVIESFDHNGIIGNYKAWMRGGTIETIFTDEVVQPGHLIFKPVSATYPVKRDYPIFFPANRITTYYVRAEKDFTGGTVQTEIIDPANDPLIDSNALALDTALLEDVEDEQKTMRVAYKPDIGKQLILRVSVINGSGEVNVEKPLTFEKFRRKELL